MARFRSSYGSSPLHVLGLLASLLIATGGVIGWFDSFTTLDIVRILVWFLGAAIAHDLILFPLYAVLDRIAIGSVHGRRVDPPPQRAPGWVYVRIPALLSGLLWLVFFPEVLRLGNDTFHTASGLGQNVYLARLLITCGVLFALSGVVYALTLGRQRRRRSLNDETATR